MSPVFFANGGFRFDDPCRPPSADSGRPPRTGPGRPPHPTQVSPALADPEPASLLTADEVRVAARGERR